MLNILMMMTANLVGFVIGTDGIKYMIDQIMGSWQGASTVGPMHFGVVTDPFFSARHTILACCVCVSLRRCTGDVRVQVRSVPEWVNNFDGNESSLYPGRRKSDKG